MPGQNSTGSRTAVGDFLVPLEESRPPQVSEECRMQAAWEVYLYARDLLSKRMGYGMVAQSMLLISFSTLVAARHEGDFFVAFFQVGVAVLGLLYTAYQYFRVRSIQDKIHYIESRYLRSRDLVFAEYMAYQPRAIFSRDVSQIGIIVVFFIAWAIMLAAALLIPPAGLDPGGLLSQVPVR
jgi:hypothetical protein